MTTSTIELNGEIAQLYEAMSERDRLDIRTIVVKAIQKKQKKTWQSFFARAEKMSVEAEANGLTEEILAEILAEIDAERPRA